MPEDAPGDPPIELTVVTVTWNNRDVVEPMLESLFEQIDRATSEVIVVDNDSADGTVEYLRGRGDVTVIENGVNAGYGVAMNRGARAARGRAVMLCNPDLVFRPGSVRALTDALAQSPQLGGVSPVVELPGDPPPVCPLLATDPGIYYGWSYFSGLQSRFAGSRTVNWNFDFSPHKTTGDLPWIHGCCGLYRREALAAVGGGFDERYFMFFEDADLGRSLRALGWRLSMARESRVLHMEGQSTRRVAVRSRVFFLESWHQYHRKHSRLPLRVAAYGVVLVALLLQAFLQLVRFPFVRGRYLPVFVALLGTHLSVPWRNLDRERTQQLADLKSRWRPLPSATAVARVS